MKIEDMRLGDVYYLPSKDFIGGVLKGFIIEINIKHKTVLLKGVEPYTVGNFGAHIEDLYEHECEAYMAL